MADRTGTYPLVTELVADHGARVLLRFADGQQLPVSAPINISEAVSYLSAGASCYVFWL